MPDAYDQVREAILNKKIIVATYDLFERKLCPHALGTKNGKKMGLFYQIEGGSASTTRLLLHGSHHNWRCLQISRMTDVQIIDGEWETALGRSRQKTCMDTVDVEVPWP